MHVAARRALVAVLSLALLVPAAALGKSVFKTGKYKAADEDKYLALSFTAGKKNVKKLTFQLTSLPGKCTSGNNLSGSDAPYDVPEASIGKKGGFKFNLKNTPQYVPSNVVIKGTLKGRKVSGTYRVKLGPTSSGSICDSGTLKWKGKRK